MLLLRPGLPERQTHDYRCHGPIRVFAALGIATGRVPHGTRKRRAGADFLAFLGRIARAYPKGEGHKTNLDDVSTHKTPAVRAWLEQHPRFHFRFVLTSASWTNQIETWFVILTHQAIRRGSVDGIHALIDAIDIFTSQWNDHAEAFALVQTADEILATAIQKRNDDTGAQHEYTDCSASPPSRGCGSPTGAAAPTRPVRGGESRTRSACLRRGDHHVLGVPAPARWGQSAGTVGSCATPTACPELALPDAWLVGAVGLWEVGELEAAVWGPWVSRHTSDTRM